MITYRDRFVNALIAHPVVPVRARTRLLRRAGWTVGEGTAVHARAELGSRQITFGSGVYVNHGLFYDGNAAVTVGDRVAFGPGVRLITATHAFGPSARRCTPGAVALPIVIEPGCWLAATVTVLPGVTIVRGCVIGAGAVLMESTEPDGLYLGVPARRVRDLESSPIPLRARSALTFSDRERSAFHPVRRRF